MLDKINNYFARNPLVFSLIVSGVIGIMVFILGLDYRTGKAHIDMSTTADNKIIEKSLEDTKGEIRVDLSGAVKRPGVYSLKEGSRVGDLLTIGGGLSDNVGSIWISRKLNMSKILTDGTKVYIPFEWEEENNIVSSEPALLDLVDADSREGSSKSVTSPLPSSAPDISKTNVNTASTSQLDELPGIGPAYAQRIVDNRPYTSYDDFKTRSGLSASLGEKIKTLIVF